VFAASSPNLTRFNASFIRLRLHAALKSLIAAASPLTNRSDDPNSTVDCAICLNCIAPFQALFLAPCSHCFHFKCIKPLLDNQGVMFLCPMCRQVANLEASVSSENLLEGFDEAGSTTQESDTESGEGTNGGNNNEETLGRAAMAEAIIAANAAAAVTPLFGAPPVPTGNSHGHGHGHSHSHSRVEDRMDVDDGSAIVATPSGMSLSRSTNSLAGQSSVSVPANNQNPGNITINLHLNGVSASQISTSNLLAEGAPAGAAATVPSPATPNEAPAPAVSATPEIKRSAPGSPVAASGSNSSGAGAPAFTFRFSIERNNSEQ
jgi:hypothetical protein